MSRVSGRALDRGRVVAAALELLDEVGLDELTMRRLADRLGVTVASLYWHVRDKGELLGLLADAIMREAPGLDVEAPWRAELERLATGLRRAVLQHRDGARVLYGSAPTGPARLRAIENVLELLRRAGLGTDDLVEASFLLNIYLTGFLLEEAQITRRVAGPQTLLSAPLDSRRQARLALMGSVRNLTLSADPELADLYRITYEGRAPVVVDHRGTLVIRQRPDSGGCDVTLSGRLPWEVHIGGAASGVDADLTRMSLNGLRVAGSVRDVTLRLPPAARVVPIRIGGSARGVVIERPAGASDGYQIEVSGGARDVTFRAAGTGGEAAEPALLELPNLSALAERLLAPDLDRHFEAGLKILLDGLEARLSGRRNPAAV